MSSDDGFIPASGVRIRYAPHNTPLPATATARLDPAFREHPPTFRDDCDITRFGAADWIMQPLRFRCAVVIDVRGPDGSISRFAMADVELHAGRETGQVLRLMMTEPRG